MANELRHSDVGTALAQDEWVSTTGHIFNGQITGDILYASSDTQLSALPITSENSVLAVSSAGKPEWVTAAYLATNITISANDSTDETVYPVFVDDATGTQGLESDTGLTYNPSSGTLDTTIVSIGGTPITSTAAEINLLDGSAASAATVTLEDSDSFLVIDATDNTLKQALLSDIQTYNIPTVVTVADTTDSTSYVALFEDATGDIAPKTDAGITYNASNGTLTATAFAGPLTGDVIGNADTATALTATLGVAAGGTGATSLTDGGILLGSGTDAVTAMAALGSGSLVIGDGTTDPVTIAAFTSSTGYLKHEYGGIEADISSVAAGGIVVGTGAGSMGIKAVGTDDYVLTADSTAVGGVAWKEGGGGDSAADIVVESGKTVTVGYPVVLNSSGNAEQLDHGRGSGGPVFKMTSTPVDGVGGSENEVFDVQYSKYNAPWQHVYDPNAEAHVFFFWLKNTNYATDSLAGDSYNAVAWVAKWDSGTDAWVVGPQQTFPDDSAGNDYSQSTYTKHLNLEAYYHPLDNTIGVAWVNGDTDSLEFTQCKVTGSGTSIGLDWAQTVQVDSATEVMHQFCPAGGASTNPRWVFYYNTTDADSNDLAVRVCNSNTFSTSSDALSSIGYEYVIYTGTPNGSWKGYAQHGITYNRETGSLMIGNSDYYYGGMFKLLYIDDLTTSTSVTSPYGSTITNWFYFLNTDGYAGASTLYMSIPNFIALDEGYVDGDYKEKWMAIGHSYSGSQMKMVTFTIDTTMTSGNHPLMYTSTQTTNSPAGPNAYQDYQYYNWELIGTGNYFRFNTTHFRREDPTMGNDHRYIDTDNVGGTAGSADGMAELFAIYFGNGQNPNSKSYFHGVGWNPSYTDAHGLSVGVPRGVTDNTNFTDVNKIDAGTSPKSITGSYNSRFYEEYWPVGSHVWTTTSSWMYDPDAGKWFLFYTGGIANDTNKSWDFGLLYRELNMPAGMDTDAESQYSLGSSNGTYIGLASSTVTGDGSATVKVLIPGSVATGLSSLIPGVVYFTDDMGNLHPRQPSWSMGLNKRIGTALTASSMKVEDLIEDSLQAEVWASPNATVGDFLYTYP